MAEVRGLAIVSRRIDPGSRRYLTAVRIQGQFSTATESYALDNVAFLAPCTDEPPPLNIRLQSNPPALLLEWPVEAACYQLEAAVQLNPAQWSPVTSPAPVLLNGRQQLILDLPTAHRFFRLRKP